ncbi:MAG: tetratricopeptide repeat protein [Gammaproteobacteria bacterium]|nr:tetratricopeptide repeat protein [Gammaproteobacteria bacterium]
MNPAFALGVVVAAAWWPFAGSDTDATIGSLRRAPPAVDAAQPVAASGARALEHYREFLALPGTPGEMRAQSMRRLADLYLGAGEEADIAGDGAMSARHYRQAIALYRQYLQEFPGRDDADTVFYALSRAHEGLGEMEASLGALDELVGRQPQGALAAEAQFRRGERLFVLGQYAAAETAYTAVLAASEDGEFFDQALYKQGWSRFKQGLYEECLEPFLGVAGRRLAPLSGAAGGRLLDGLDKAERELVEDSLRAMSLAVSQLDGIASLDALLDRQGALVPFADVIYSALGELYLAQERYGDAADAYRGFVRREPAHPRAPYLQAEVIRAYSLGKFPSRVLEAKAEYVELYGLHSGYWENASPAERPLVVQYLKESLADLASYDHERAQRTRTADAYQRAALWYRRYLEYFPQDPESARRNFLLAEILFEAGDFAAAAVEYQRSAYDYGAHPQAGEAGYAALLAAREHEKQLGGPEQESFHAVYIDGALRFVAAFPEHEQAATVQVDVAEDLFDRGELERALVVAGEVVVRTPPAAAELERVAWTVLAHGQFDLGRYAEAEQAYRRLRDLGVADAERAREIEERIAASVYRQAEAAQAAGDSAAAVTEFLRVADAAPASSIRPAALYDAAALLIAGERWSEAVDVLQRFRGEFPGHQLGTDVSQKLAVAMAAAGRGAEAADEFEAVAGLEDLGPEVQREALWRAADLHREAGNGAAERRVYETIVARFPQPFAEAMEARAKLAAMTAAADDPGERQRWLRDIIAADAAGGDARTERSRYLAAHAALDLAAPLRDAFNGLALGAPLAASMKTKKQRMELALAAYGRAADYAVAEVTTAATYETAELYRRLGADLLASEQPAGLSADELEEYELLLEEQAFPFEEKAIELHAVNAGRSADGVYDEWVQRSFGKLAELSPARYARTERSESHVADID